MSDNDLTSGDPWGLGDFGSDDGPETSEPPTPPPTTDLPDDLADLSTIAPPPPPPPPSLDPIASPPEPPQPEPTVDPGSPGGSDEVAGLDLGDLTSLGDADAAADTATTEDLASLADGLEIDSPDLDGISDLADLPDIDLEDVTHSLEPDLDGISDLADLPDVDLEDLTRSLEPDFEAPTENLESFDTVEEESADEAPMDHPTPTSSAPRMPVSPMLAASGLFGTSPHLPPLDAAEESATETPADTFEADSAEIRQVEVEVESVAPDEIQFDAGSLDFGSIELSSPDAAATEFLPDVDAESLPDGTLDTDLSAILSGFGDEFDDASSVIEPSADISPPDADPEPDLVPELIADLAADLDPDPTDLDPVGLDESSDLNFEGTTPPSVFKELENLGDQEDDKEPEPVFGAVFGDSTATLDPFEVVLNTSAEDDAIAAVAAAAASIDTPTEPARPMVIEDPTVDDLPAFLIDEPTDEPMDGPTFASPDDTTSSVAADAESGDIAPEEPAPITFNMDQTIEEMPAEPAGIEPLPPMEAPPADTVEPDPFSSLLVDSAEPPQPAEPEMDQSALAGSPPPVTAETETVIGTAATALSDKKPAPPDWASRRDDAYEGWVEDEAGVETWRMIVTNLPTISGYTIDKHLGLSVADSMVASHDVTVVAAGRRAAIDALTEDAVLRGAHAVVAVTHSLQTIGDQMLVTVSGTAVTVNPIGTEDQDD